MINSPLSASLDLNFQVVGPGGWSEEEEEEEEEGRGEVSDLNRRWRRAESERNPIRGQGIRHGYCNNEKEEEQEEEEEEEEKEEEEKEVEEEEQ